MAVGQGEEWPAIESSTNALPVGPPVPNGRVGAHDAASGTPSKASPPLPMVAPPVWTSRLPTLLDEVNIEASGIRKLIGIDELRTEYSAADWWTDQTLIGGDPGVGKSTLMLDGLWKIWNEWSQSPLCLGRGVGPSGTA